MLRKLHKDYVFLLLLLLFPPTLQFDLSSLPGVEKCCNKHDKCYGQCGMPKLTCEDQFAKCLDGVCDVMKGVMNFNSEELEGKILDLRRGP